MLDKLITAKILCHCGCGEIVEAGYNDFSDTGVEAEPCSAQAARGITRVHLRKSALIDLAVPEPEPDVREVIARASFIGMTEDGLARYTHVL